MDEGRFGLKSTYTRMWTEKGRTPTVPVIQGYKNFYTYSCVCPRNGDHFSLFLPEVSTEMMNIFLQEFAEEHQGEQVLMIMDQAGWHRAKNLKVPHNIKIWYLPPYSPELNPVERLWRHLKKAAIHNILLLTLDQVIDAVQREIRALTNEKIQSTCRCDYL